MILPSAAFFGVDFTFFYLFVLLLLAVMIVHSHRHIPPFRQRLAVVVGAVPKQRHIILSLQTREMTFARCTQRRSIESISGFKMWRNNNKKCWKIVGSGLAATGLSYPLMAYGSFCQLSFRMMAV